MSKRLNYIILPNSFIYDRYGDKENKVFKDVNLNWKQMKEISGYWSEFEYRSIYSYQSLMEKIKNVVRETEESPCNYNKERLLMFTKLYQQLNIGETLFVEYDNVRQ